jgi:hypothetical protein
MRVTKSQWQIDTEERLEALEREATWRDCWIKELQEDNEILTIRLQALYNAHINLIELLARELAQKADRALSPAHPARIALS